MTDRYLQRVLSNWASQQQAPENARARLLLNASARNYPLEETQVYLLEDQYTKTTNLYSTQANEPARIMDWLWMLHLPVPALRMI